MTDIFAIVQFSEGSHAIVK